MRVDELRSLSLFAGLTDEQLAQLAEAGTEVRVEPGVDLFREGEHADFWWVLFDGAIDLVRYVGREDTVVARMDAPGRWAGGFKAWDEHGVYLATGRGVANGRVLRVPAEVLRERCNAWFPFAGHLIEGLYRTARTIESTARQRESLVTLGTLAAGLAHELNNPAAAATRAVDALDSACQLLLSSLGRLAQGEISAGSSRRSTRCVVRSCPVPRSSTRWPSPTRRRSCRRGSLTTASSVTGSSLRRSLPLESTSPGASRRRTCFRDHPWSRAWNGWRARSPWPRSSRR